MSESLPHQDLGIGSAGGLPVVTSPAEIDIANCQRLLKALLSAIDEHTTVIVDMSATVFCDSSGIAALVVGMKRSRACGGEVRLVLEEPAVRRVFKVTGADRIFRIFGDVAEAVAARPPEPIMPLQSR
jgi:anti-anti-sigma factor